MARLGIAETLELVHLRQLFLCLPSDQTTQLDRLLGLNLPISGRHPLRAIVRGLSDLTRELLSIEISKEQQSSNWGSKIISKKQKSYAANDVLYLHKLKEKLEAILLQENRIELAEKVFSFLKVRVELDLAGFEDLDIFSH